jgi:hypothetical protein
LLVLTPFLFCIFKPGGIAIFDDPDFCSELVEAEVAAEVYNKLELLGIINPAFIARFCLLLPQLRLICWVAMADGYASVAEFVRIYMSAFLDQHQRRPSAASAPPTGNSVPAAAVANSTGPVFGSPSTPTSAAGNRIPVPIPTHHLPQEINPPQLIRSPLMS